MQKADNVLINILHSYISVPAKHVVLEVIKSYGVDLTDDQVHKIQQYMGLLLLWNQKLSLTSITDPREILGRHFGESFFASIVCNFGLSRLADVGSGAGFPGLALKIANEKLQVILIEQHTKKCVFLSEAIRLLDLSSVRVIRSTYEALSPEIGEFDFIATRALGNHKDFLHWCESRLKSTGRAVLWLGSTDAAKIMSQPGWKWDPPVAIPGTRNNVIVSGSH